ncbi:Macrolide export ATP-binding/permease protein MacB [Anaerolineales bacterium]|nr:Macrolide export ATP-binding/permease protein MacB [Anaerolineales bacterium]
MRPRWRKVLHDLWDNKARTLLVVFSIAVGVFSIGVISGTYQIISNDMSISYAANHPANVELRMDNFDDDILSTIRNGRGVGEAEARRVVNFRVQEVGSAQWVSLDVVALEDFDDNKVNLLAPVSGAVKAEKNEVLLEKDALKKLDVEVGDNLIFELPDGLTKKLKVVGIVQDVSTGAGDFLAPPFAYIAMKTLPTLRQPELYNRAYVTVAEEYQEDIDHIREVGGNVKDKLEKNGVTVARTRSSETHKHPLGDTVNAILGILLALGILIVFLSSSLIANTLNALLSQHLRHIGVIKLVGGRRPQVFSMYFTLIMAFAILALLIAVPLGGVGAYRLSAFIADTLRFNLLGYRIVPMAFFIQIAVGLLVPIIAGLAPVISGSRITVLRALSGDVAGDESKPHKHEEKISWFDALMVRLTRLLAQRGIHFPRPFILSLRNTFRRRGRLLLTLFTLTMGGAIFIAVFNVRVTLHDYIGAIQNYFRDDVTVNYDEPYRLHEVQQFGLQVDGVQYVEGWQSISIELLYPDDSVADNAFVLAPPAESKLVSPLLTMGRWIRKGDIRKLAISEAALVSFPNLKPGDYLQIKVDGRKESWEVVGIFKFVDQQGIVAYAPYEYISQVTHLANRAYSFRFVTVQHDRAYQDMMAEKLDDYFREQGFKVRKAESGLSSMDTASESLDILVIFLLIMAVLTAIVGAMGLTGTMGMNVMERTREIGIMRAVGADDRAVMRTVIAEGLTIGFISFVLAIFLSIPFTFALSDIVSTAVFQTPIKVVFTFLGYVIWLGLVLLLSVFGSILPARSAARLTIREVLAYE